MEQCKTITLEISSETYERCKRIAKLNGGEAETLITFLLEGWTNPKSTLRRDARALQTINSILDD